MSITPQGQTDGLTQSPNNNNNSTPISKQPKKKGFLSFLCCGVPDSASPADANDAPVPANKLAKVPSGRPTTASKPEQSTSTAPNTIPMPVQSEKDALRQEAADAGQELNEKDVAAGKNLHSEANMTPVTNGDLNTASTDKRDQPLPALPKEEHSAAVAQNSDSNPAVVVQGPSRSESTNAVTQSSLPEEKDAEGDTKMEESQPVPADKEEAPAAAPEREATPKSSLPPPPPVPQVQAGPSEVPVAPEAEPKQQWLLPPIAPRFKGKKCLVLDLDETLVHSSFKVR